MALTEREHRILGEMAEQLSLQDPDLGRRLESAHPMSRPARWLIAWLCGSLLAFGVCIMAAVARSDVGLGVGIVCFALGLTGLLTTLCTGAAPKIPR